MLMHHYFWIGFAAGFFTSLIIYYPPYNRAARRLEQERTKKEWLR